ncbi:MAG: hypothetical protein EA397_12430 [Deltaproteobacteria bacterium]|nr:MAG: hypothetical protein EA397_12430 [Deltaproteobacteria bacterium]
MRGWVSLLFIAGCSWGIQAPEPPGPDPDATRLAGERLCYVFQHAGKPCRVSEDLVEVEGKTYRLGATITYSVDLGGQAARMVRYEASISGEPLSYGVEILGKGTSPTDALSRAAEEWAGLAGTALADAVLDTGVRAATHATLRAGGKKVEGDPPPAVQIGSYTAYPGAHDLRGATAPGAAMDHLGLLEAIRGEIDALDPSRPHSLLFSVQFDGKGFRCERAMIDGVDHEQACRVASTFEWPEPANRYQLRQFYMLVPRSADDEG